MLSFHVPNGNEKTINQRDTMKSIRTRTLATVLAAGLAFVSSYALAQQSSAQATSVKGKVTSVDKSAKTLVIDGETFYVLPTTRLTSRENRASLDDLQAGAQINGLYKQSTGNRRELLWLEISEAVGGSEAGATSASGAQFSGKVSKVDAEAKTVNIGNQTYRVLPTTRIISDDEPATFEDIQVGSQLTGRYKLSAEKLRNLLSVEVPKAVGGTESDATSESGASFQGRVSQVNTQARTLTINNQTYQFLPTTRITKNDEARFEDIKKGTPLSGQYKLSSENKMNLLAIEIREPAEGGRQRGATSESGAPFQGRVTKVDPEAKTITVGNRFLWVLPTTRITSEDQPATFEDIQVGSQLNGRYKTSSENRMQLLTLEVSKRAGDTRRSAGGAKDVATSESGASFSGKIAKVDRTAQTITIGSRTFQMLPTTTATMRTGRPATLANLKANQEVTGTYKQSAEGKLQLLTLQVGAER